MIPKQHSWACKVEGKTPDEPHRSRQGFCQDSFFHNHQRDWAEAQRPSSEVLKHHCVAEAAAVDSAKLVAEGGSAYKYQCLLAHKSL